MTISYNWLKTYLALDISAEKVGEILTDTGLEVEGIEKVESVKGGLQGVVVGEVLTCVQHPNADRLKITTVTIGAGEPLQIVCGAPNVAIGQKVPIATISTILYADDKPFEIKKGKIRGEESHGMICAEDELGLGKSHDGIMILAESAKVGMPASEYFKIETDFVFEIGLTPNRTDAMGHYGVARDLRAGLAQHGISSKLSLPQVDFKVDDESLIIPINVQNTEACPQYLGLTISGVSVSDSPTWLKNRLLAIGLKPINNVVDVTNYVLYELGHPLHAFDADKIVGAEVLVQNLSAGTIFKTLDGVERKLHEDDLMICNSAGPMCLAGVFGGADSGVSAATKNVFLEAAYFNPVSVRKTAKRHGLNTDASFRYERGVDPNITRYAMMRAAMLIREIAGGKISSQIQESISNSFPKKEVELSLNRLNALIGNQIPAPKVEEILELLEIEIQNKEGDKWQLAIPTYRVDVTREADVIEEFLRIYGFNNVQLPERMHISVSEKDELNPSKTRKTATSLLVSNGYTEIMNNSLTKEIYYSKFQADQLESLVRILNPLSQDLGVMRQTLLFGGLEVVLRNVNRQTRDIKIFEFGNTYFKDDDGKYREEEKLMIVLSGKVGRESWLGKPQDASFFELKGIVVALLEKLGLSDLKEKVAPETNDLHFVRGEKTFAIVREVEEEKLEYFEIDQAVFEASINWDFTLKASAKNRVKYVELPRFPLVRRDLALLLNNEIEYESLRIAAKKAGGKLLKEVGLFDVYRGKNLPENKKSYAMSFILQDENETLTDKRVEGVMSKILSALEKEFKVELRA